MKVLMVNKFLYPKGGAETYTFAVGDMLKEHGHIVQFFGLRNPKNTVGNDANAYVADMDFSAGILKNLNAPFRIIYNSQARKEIRKVLNLFQPDVVHLNNIHYHLTPSIILEIDKWRRQSNKKCIIIYTTHDYQLICPSHGLFDKNMKPCELCLDGKYRHCVQTKCLKNSRAKSLLGTLDGYFWKSSKVYSLVDIYLCCSQFIKRKLDTQDRFRGRTVCIHNFKNVPPISNIHKKDYILEFGHLSKDKGTDTLIEVAKRMPQRKFVFIGYGESIKKMEGISNIKYLGFKTGDELNRLIAEAAISVCPSEQYENCPYSVIESILYKTPVVGANMGGIPELIDTGKTGELFEAGNVDGLEQAISTILGNLDYYTEQCELVEFENAETYYKKLIKLYREGKVNAE